MYIKEFNVIYTEKKTDEYRLYICKKSLENQLYRIFELADRNKIAEYIKYFNSLNFKDFYGDFSIYEKYYIVFKHQDGIIAGDSDWKKLSAKDIVKALVLQNPPIEIAVPMLSFNNIFVYEKEIRFAYVLPMLDNRACKGLLEEKLADMIDLIWSEHRTPEAKRWLDSLRRGKFSHLVIALKYMPENEKAIPECKSEYYDRIKKILLKIAVTAAVLAGILIIIFKLMAEYDTDKLEYDKIDSLGGIDLID